MDWPFFIGRNKVRQATKGSRGRGRNFMNLNQITLVDYVTKDAEVSATTSGKEVTTPVYNGADYEDRSCEG